MSSSKEEDIASVYKIQYGIRCYLGTREYICIPNVSWGFFKNIECDMIAIGGNNKVHEYEIKRSWSDFMADFKKVHFHDDIRICNMTYVLPKSFADERLVAFCANNYKNFKREFDFLFYNDDDGGIVPKERITVTTQWGGYGTTMAFPKQYQSETYITPDMLTTIRGNDAAEPYRRGLFLEERAKLYRLALIKIWSDIAKIEKNTLAGRSDNMV